MNFRKDLVALHKRMEAFGSATRGAYVKVGVRSCGWCGRLCYTGRGAVNKKYCSVRCRDAYKKARRNLARLVGD